MLEHHARRPNCDGTLTVCAAPFMHNALTIASTLVLFGQQAAEDTSTLQGVLWGLGLLACVIFLVGIGMSYRTWRIPMLLLVPAVIIAAGFFLGYAVVALKAQQQWGQTNNALEEQVKKVDALNEELEKGQFKDNKLIRPGVKQVNNAVVDMVRDRGRMWTGAKPDPPDAATGEVQVSVVEPKEHQIKPKTLLYVFEERPTGGSYLGVFRVSAVLGGDMPMEEPMADAKPVEEKKADGEKKEGEKKEGEAKDGEKKDGEKKDADKKDTEKKDGEKKDGEKKDGEKSTEKPAEKAEPKAPAADGAKGPSMITLTPAWRISPRELDRLKASTGPWTLYDKMPPDDHALFVDIDKNPYTKAPLPIDRTEAIRGIVPKQVAQEYVDDYQLAKDAKAVPPGRLFVYVKFIKDYTAPAEPIVAPAAEAAPANAGGFGGGGGAAAGAGAPAAGGQNGAAGGAAPAQPQPLDFKAGAMAWITPEAAKELEVQGVIQLLSQFRYERPLRDYAFLFDAEYIDRERLANEIATLQQQNTALEVVFEKNVDLVKRTTEEQARLQNDLARYNFEKQALARHSAALTQQYQELGAKLRTLFLANQQMAAQIDELERKAAAAVNRRAPAPPQALHVPPADAAAAIK